jgi:hypothetical protein
MYVDTDTTDLLFSFFCCCFFLRGATLHVCVAQDIPFSGFMNTLYRHFVELLRRGIGRSRGLYLFWITLNTHMHTRTQNTNITNAPRWFRTDVKFSKGWWQHIPYVTTPMWLGLPDDSLHSPPWYNPSTSTTFSARRNGTFSAWIHIICVDSWFI